MKNTTYLICTPYIDSSKTFPLGVLLLRFIYKKRKQIGIVCLEIQISEPKYPGIRLRNLDCTAATSLAVLTCSSKRY
jgi:hypothetical protein